MTYRMCWCAIKKSLTHSLTRSSHCVLIVVCTAGLIVRMWQVSCGHQLRFVISYEVCYFVVVSVLLSCGIIVVSVVCWLSQSRHCFSRVFLLLNDMTVGKPSHCICYQRPFWRSGSRHLYINVMKLLTLSHKPLLMKCYNYSIVFYNYSMYLCMCL